MILTHRPSNEIDGHVLPLFLKFFASSRASSQTWTIHKLAYIKPYFQRPQDAAVQGVRAAPRDATCVPDEMIQKCSLPIVLISPICSFFAMPTATKKSTTKSTKAKSAANAKHHSATHPPWVDMIKVGAVPLIVLSIPFLMLKRT